MTATIRAVLIDDEPPARERLTALLREHPDVEIVGEAADIESSTEICDRLRPCLIFLDIQLPRGSGFDLLPRLTFQPAVIFVTASDSHAVRAFDVNAIDYLLKPIHPERLAAALARVQPVVKKPVAIETVTLEESRGSRMVAISDISYIKAEGNYTLVYLKNGPSGFVRRSLVEWEKLLPEKQFLRIDRSLLIRLKAIQYLGNESRDNASLFLEGSAVPIVLGRRASLNMRRAMKMG